VYEHGKRIADRIGLTSSAETFNPVLVEFYEKVGYLPDAIINYLMLLGWAHEDGKSEMFTRKEMIDLFTLERVNKSSASLDVQKLFAFQERYMQQLLDVEKISRVLPFLQRAGLAGDPVSADDRELVAKILTAAAHRITLAGDILDYDFFFVPDEQMKYDDKAFEKNVCKVPELLKKAQPLLSATMTFDAATLKTQVEILAQSEGVKLGPASQMLRVAVTGKDVGFGTFETMAILGRDRCMARIQRALARL